MNSTDSSQGRRWRIALLVMVLAGIVWLGAVNARTYVAGDILKSGTVEIDESRSPDAIREAFRIIALSSCVIICSYVLTLGASIVFLATSPFRLKDHGWLLISAILFYLFVPVEFYTMWIDWKMIRLEFFVEASNAEAYALFVARVKALAGVPLIGLLCYYTIIGLAVFQPLKRSLPPVHEA